MSERLLASVTAALLLLGCADPKYASAVDRGHSEKPSQSACQATFPSGECVALTWDKMPTETEFGSFVLNTFFYNAADGTKTPADFAANLGVLIWMPDMPDMGSSPVAVKRIDVGTYHVANVFFSMKGKWEIRVQLKDGKAVRGEAIIPIQID